MTVLTTRRRYPKGAAFFSLAPDSRNDKGRGETQAARSAEEPALKSGLLSEQIARTVDALAALFARQHLEAVHARS
jgi:hypothetical protein